MRKSKYWAMAVAGVVLVAMTGACAYFLYFALWNGDRHYDEGERWTVMTERHPQMAAWSDSIRGIQPQGEEHISRQWLRNEDGDSIRLYVIPAQHRTARTAVLAHGYKNCAVDMMHLAYLYHHNLGCNVVAYDQYGHGASSGDWIQMGWRDRRNLILCARRAEQLFGDSLVLHGVSMGGATVMMASGEEDLPESVRMIVDDCGYTSVWDEFEGELRNQFGLPAFPLLHLTSLMSRLALGWSFTEASSLRAVSRTHTPMLFIHGEADTYVPTPMVHRLYEAHQGRKACWLAPGSAHAASYRDHPEEYLSAIRNFAAENREQK